MDKARCGIWGYAEGKTLVCTEDDDHRGDHHDRKTGESWSTPHLPRR